jgi:hypothetical protein
MVPPSMKCKVFLTDEGFGPLVRFAALLHHLRRRIPHLEVEVQTYNHVEMFPSLADCVSIVKRRPQSSRDGKHRRVRMILLTITRTPPWFLTSSAPWV